MEHQIRILPLFGRRTGFVHRGPLAGPGFYIEHAGLVKVGDETYGPEELKNYQLALLNFQDEPDKRGEVEEHVKAKGFRIAELK